MMEYLYHSLEDFLIANMLTVDAQVDDGWGSTYPVKGREIEATVLFADITGFSARTADLDPTETLAFVNHFFTWIGAESLRGRPGIVDKYIGDEVMVVFSKEFGSGDPFADAISAARWMGQNDAFSFTPHVGIASGVVIVGYVGTALKYNCSVFGAPVALAARCAGVRAEYESPYSTSIAFPATDWGDRDFNTLFLPQQYSLPDGSLTEHPQTWKLLDPMAVELKNLGRVDIRHAVNGAMWFPTSTATERAQEAVRGIGRAGRRWKRPGATG